ncbi:MAG: response regulator, partial [Desulfobacterales bacterium]|nr:response regulator [Desulfobacterales bacterium]
MPKKILIVHDDPDVILFLSTVLKDHGYITVDASNGREGLERVKSDHPDLILLDLMMPQKSGIALLSDLKKDDALKEIP